MSRIDSRDVTVVIPAKDRESLLPRALASVAKQSVPVREVIVVDDGSSDRTSEVAGGAGATVISISRSGGSGPARNRGILAASTTWIAFLDSDDEWDEDHLATVLADADGYVLVSSPGRSGQRIAGNALSKNLALTPELALAPGAVIFTSGTIALRSALIDAGLFRALPRAQDLDMWVRVLEQGRGVALSRPTVTYYTHDEQASRDRMLMRDCFDRILRDCAERDWFSPRLRDRAYTRWQWDSLVKAVRGRDLRSSIVVGSWLARRPWTWPTLLAVLQQRSASRRYSPEGH